MPHCFARVFSLRTDIKRRYFSPSEQGKRSKTKQKEANQAEQEQVQEQEQEQEHALSPSERERPRGRKSKRKNHNAHRGAFLRAFRLKWLIFRRKGI